nr:MAG: putative RNA-dependent RNA polymerase [Narnaviridae sp.]
MNNQLVNNYMLIHLIDGILDRLHAVRPEWKYRHDGPKQWLYIAELKISHEIELVQAASVLSAPSFPPSEEKRSDGYYELEDGTITKSPPIRLASGSPLPKVKSGQTFYSVDFHVIQALSGVRAVLLVLVDSCASCAKDEDYIGNCSWTDSLSVIRIMSKWTEEDFVPNSKYWKDWPLARFLKNPLPPVPASWTRSPMSVLFSGDTGRYMNRLASYPSDREDSFLYYRAVFGLAQSKRGFAQVPRSFVKRSMVKHSRQLSTPPTSSPDLVSVRTFAETFFKGFRCPKIFASLPSQEGSTKASVESSREKGGAREFLRHINLRYRDYINSTSHTGFSVDNEKYFVPNEEPDDLVRMFNPNHQVFEERGLPPLSPQDWRSLSVLYTPAVSRSYLSLSSQTKLKKLEESHPEIQAIPTARVAEVLEPLKVRLITAMDAVRSHISRPLQGALWRYLRSSPVFRLIGEPVTESILHDLVDRHRRNGGSEDPFVSGDYSAATDGLDIRVSKEILNVILECLDPEDIPYKEYIGSVLLEQVLLYPSWTNIDPVIQKNGQLMGSILSFPLLCLSNLFAYVMSLPDSHEILQSKSRMDGLAVLINGDDILFRSSSSHYERWLEEINRVGFVPSVGKNFRHPRFFTVNSIPIEYRRAPTPLEFWRGWSWADMQDAPIPFEISQVPKITINGFLNVGLLTGQAKLTGREALGALPLSGWHAGSVLEALNPAQAHRWFLKYHRVEILNQTRFGSTTLNLFAHPLLGGLGFTVPPGIEPRFSPEQRRIARSLFLSASYSYEGKESDYSLDSLLFLESDLATPMSSLGRLNRRVRVELYPTGTPLPEGYSPYTDTTGVQPLAMVHAPPQDEEGTMGLKARCRLSSNRLRQLTKRFGLDTVDLHPLDKMTEFPFTPVKVLASTFIPVEGQNPNNASKFVEKPYSKVYCQEIPFQDISAPITDLESVPNYIVEDWEMANVSLFVIKEEDDVVPSPPILSSVRKEGRMRRVLDKERLAQNMGKVYVRTSAEQRLFE